MPTIAEIFETMSYGPAPESPENANAWLDSHARRFDLFIANAWQPPQDGAYEAVYTPSDGTPLAQVAVAGAADVDAAVQAARRAQPAWAALTGGERARYLYAIARQIQKHARLFAVLEALDNGKPIRETRDIDIPLVARHFYYHAGWAQLAATELAGYAPVGVIGQVIPWNFPLLMLAWKVAPALAMGNTIVLKPAPATPLTALLFAQIVREIGLPAGVVNVLPGDDGTGAAIVAHDDIDKVAFTGSTAVGRILRAATAGSGKRLSLELGGKSPFIVYDSADQHSAIEGIVDAIWFNQGEVCCAGSRLLVQENIADTFIARLKERMGRLREGHSLDKSIDIGAVVDQNQWNTIDKWVALARAEGASIFQPDLPLPEKGCYYRPTLITDVGSASTVVQEEIFGPVLTVQTFRTPDEAIALANNTRYGLAATIFSDDINLALDAARRVKAGTIWVNGTNFFDAAAGFGGYRESGFGREGGREGLFEYLRPAWQARPRPQIDPAALEAWGKPAPAIPSLHAQVAGEGPAIDRTPKLYIGGRQKRPDGNYTRDIVSPDGVLVGQAGDGNRKDIRDAVEAAHKAKNWAYYAPHTRAQILYYIGENLSVRRDEFAARLTAQTGAKARAALAEVDAAIERFFLYAAYADKYGGTVQETTLTGLVTAIHEPLGVVGIACPDEPALLGFAALLAPAIARGNTVVVIPSAPYPLSATDLYQVFDTSDLPAGVVNIVTGDRESLTATLAAHEDVDAMWYFGTAAGALQVEQLSTSNMKRTWVDYGIARDWYAAHQGYGEEFLREAVQVKNIWVPFGV